MDKQEHKEHAAKAEGIIKEIKSELEGIAGDSKEAAQPAEQQAGKHASQEKKRDEPAKKIAELSDQLLRLQAEFDNYKKRTAKEKEQLSRQSEARLMLRLLPVYEEIGLAEQEAAKIGAEPVRKGVLMVLSKLRSAFEKEGLQEMKADGEKLDPFRHETALREDSDVPEGNIVHVIQKGYLLKGEVLRHAIVSVSSGKKPAEEKKEGGKE